MFNAKLIYTLFQKIYFSKSFSLSRNVIIALSLSISASNAAVYNELEIKDDNTELKINSLDFGIELNSLDKMLMLDEINSSNSAIINLVNQALVFLRTGERKKAIAHLHRAWQMEPEEVEIGVKIALLHLESQEFEAALNTIKNVQKATPEDPLGYKLAGIAYSGLDDIKNSKISFEQALKLQPGAPDASIAVARMAINERNFAKARNIYETSLVHYPDNIRTLLLLAQLESIAKRPEQAIIRIKEAIILKPDSYFPKYTLIKAYILTKDFERANAAANSATKQFPNNLALRELLGVVQLKNGSPTEAVITLKSVIYANSQSVTAHYNLALAYEQLDRNKKAVEELQLALRKDPTSKPVKFMLARLLAKTEQFDLANKTIQELSTSTPDNYEVLKLEGEIALIRNDFQTAILSFKKAQAINDTSPISIKLAYALMKTNQLDAAYAVLKERIKNNPTDMVAKSSLADFYLAQGKKKEAEELLIDIVEQGNQFNGYNRAKTLLNRLQQNN